MIMTRRRESGAALIVILLLVALLIGGMALWLGGQYNGLVAAEEAVDGQWANVENVYQRRLDLIPNLVETVRGAAEFEQETLTAVVEARSKVGQITPEAASEILSNPDQFAKFQQAQDGLSSALSRLMVVVERYPELQSVQAFRDLMVQLEGTENRISTERRKFNEVAQGYNGRLRKVPTSWFISALGWPFQAKSYFSAQPGAEVAPKVEF